jgi:polyhydroxyalkanoate synthesis regulator phasin
VIGPQQLLAKGRALAGGGVRIAAAELVKRGRMTREDARELAENFADIARRQAQDARAEMGGAVRRHANRAALRGALGKLRR